MPTALPPHPSLEFLQSRARSILDAHRVGDPLCCAILRRLRRFDGAEDASILGADVTLQQVQLALALEYGLPDWPTLRARVESMRATPRKTDYDRVAAEFDDDPARDQYGPDRMLADRLGRNPGRVFRALDVGCGTGNFLRVQLKAFGDRVRWSAVDPSAAMLDRARAKSSGVEFFSGRAEALPYPAASFDHVVSTFSIHHWDDKGRGLDEVRRVSSPGATLTYANMDAHQSRGWWIYRFFPEALHADEARFWPAELIGKGLATRGYRVNIDYFYRDITPIPLARLDGIERRRNWASPCINLTDAQFARGIARIRAAVAKDPDGSVENEFTIVRIEGTLGGAS